MLFWNINKYLKKNTTQLPKQRLIVRTKGGFIFRAFIYKQKHVYTKKILHTKFDKKLN